MMGGKMPDNSVLNLGKVKKLEDEAKKVISKGVSGKVNVFISFSSEDLGEVNLLRGQAKNENSDIEFNDWSVKVPFDSERADYIRRRIRERIRQCSVTIVYVSEETASSKWVAWEIKESLNMGKGIVAMHKGSNPPNRLPKAVVDNKIPVVSWNQKELSNAIKQQSENR